MTKYTKAQTIFLLNIKTQTEKQILHQSLDF